MKKVILSLSFAFISIAAFSQTPPQEKVFVVKLTESQLMAVLNLINDAKLDGETRRAFDKLLRDQAIAQLPKQDTTAQRQPIPQPKKEEKKP